MYLFKLEPPPSPLGGNKLGSKRFFGNVINLSKEFQPTKTQYNLLNKGLTFVPTLDLHKNQRLHLQLDLQNYHRRIKLAHYFKNSDQNKLTPFLPKSTWIPPTGAIHDEIHNLIKKDNEFIKRRQKIPPEKPNLSKDEVKALRDLIHNKTIVIKPADKGSSVVIMSRQQYITEALRQLNDDKYYKKLNSPIYPETIPLVKDIIKRLHDKKFINKKQKTYLEGSGNIRERRFYILPKIHKEPEKWNPPFQIPPGRPIVSDCSSETYHTAEFIEFYLNPLSNKHPSYVKDTYHFIELIKKFKIPPNSFFFTFDVDNLYTNIDTQSGLKAIERIFQKYPDKNRPDLEILELLKINLTRNDFVFDSTFYLQLKGTAMGKRFAPSYANIFMACWEEDALNLCPKKPLHYLRYLDDIWGVWTHSREDFELFLKNLNSFDPSIKLKYTINDNTIDFLDTTIYKGSSYTTDHTLDVKVYFKKTDTHALLFKTSFHPRHTYQGLVKSQLLRFHRICSQQDDFWEAVTILFTALRRRGYSRSFLKTCLKGFRQRKERDDDNKKIIPFITTFSSYNNQVNHVIKNNFEKFIQQTDLLTNHKIISAYRRNKNLSDFLVKAKLPSLPLNRTERHPEYFCNVDYIRNQKDGTLFHIPRRFSPRTTNCIYVIFCLKCKKQYIGETKNDIMTRMWQHKYNIQNQKETHTPLVSHFIQHGWTSLRISAIQDNPSWTDLERRKTERRWIYSLNTVEPIGLNQKWVP